MLVIDAYRIGALFKEEGYYLLVAHFVLFELVDMFRAVFFLQGSIFGLGNLAHAPFVGLS